MGTLAFDSHAYVKRLTGAGMPEPQAEVLADEQSRLLEGDLATKRDIEEHRTGYDGRSPASITCIVRPGVVN